MEQPRSRDVADDVAQLQGVVGGGGGGGVGTYYLPDRTHLGLAKDTPAGRAVEQRPSPCAKVVALPRCGGLHHRYVWGEAA